MGTFIRGKSIEQKRAEEAAARKAYTDRLNKTRNIDIEYLKNASPEQIERFFDHLTQGKAGQTYGAYAGAIPASSNPRVRNARPRAIEAYGYNGRFNGGGNFRSNAAFNKASHQFRTVNRYGSNLGKYFEADALKNKASVDKGNKSIERNNRKTRSMAELEHIHKRNGGLLSNSQATEARALGLLPRKSVDPFESVTSEKQESNDNGRASLRQRVRNGY